jgi:hypothetical protein
MISALPNLASSFMPQRPHGFPCSSHDDTRAEKKRARGGEGREELVLPSPALTVSTVGINEVCLICVTLDLA